MNEQRIAVVTGGSRGLGRSAALALAHKGRGVVLTYRTQRAAADEVVGRIQAAGGRAVALELDVSQPTTFAAFAERLSLALRQTWGVERFDFLVNNAGSGLHQSFAETTEAQLDALFAEHVKGPYLLTQRLLPLLADGGRIVNLSSGLARFALPGYSAYASMKGAVEVHTRYLAKELGPRRIAVNTLAPGPIATDFNGGAVRDNPQLNGFIASQTALGRAGLPDDVGGAVANLLDDGSAWVTAQRLEVSGGFLI
jgi:NAD(P)-dependent dehydrogenase (short-subunit alcohol dehydrogenase family)